MNCPVICWGDQVERSGGIDDDEALRACSKTMRVDVVVMSQACDLEYDKVRDVILCPHLTLEEYRSLFEEEMHHRGQTPTAKAWKRFCSDVRDGFVWNLAMLGSEDHGALGIQHRIVDFRNIYSIPRPFLESLLAQRGHKRLRLRPPYREHLSQAFARFFMRVGLPSPIIPTW